MGRRLKAKAVGQRREVILVLFNSVASVRVLTWLQTVASPIPSAPSSINSLSLPPVYVTA